ncbi:hypothetical protein CSUI_006925 [Cystoisospora suis]|uniref:Uncharacterized protein n=1 Tax=Cystoisospora suis TaxID=483139 RepID=A0A2C6KFG8_9APIC|nr:hypothetical protein CSUI_006925 [Cystoisospora suis]
MHACMLSRSEPIISASLVWPHETSPTTHMRLWVEDQVVSSSLLLLSLLRRPTCLHEHD